MAEIILEPTVQSKVIPLSIRLNDTDTSLVSQLVTNRQFSTADTDAWFSFTLEGLAATTGTFDLTLINLQDKSVFNHTDKMFNTNPFYYKLDSGTDELTNEIRHAGKWVGQLVVTLANGDSATRKFIFGIEGHILDGTVVQTILLEDYNALITDIEASKDELTQYNIDYASLIGTVTEQEAARLEAEELRVIADALRETKEGIRQATFEANEVIRDGIVDSAIEGEMISQAVATKLTEKEATFAPRMLSLEQQLADTLNKSAITLTHMFADNTARDVYFVANPTELMEQLFIKVGTAYQQYIEGVWTGSVPIVSEQLSATNQPIVDTGNYFATDKTNDALQELGAHKASTSNPHGVTKAQVGLGNVDNTSDANKPISTATQTALNLKADKTTTDGINAKNLVVNGDFITNDTSSWELGGGTGTKTVSGGVLTINYTSYFEWHSGVVTFAGQAIQATPNNKFYMAMQVSGIGAVLSYGGVNRTSATVDGNWTKLSCVVTPTETAYMDEPFAFGMEGLLNTTYQIKQFTVIDLTATFGAGNEPTKLEMDELMKVIPNQWWDGEITLTQKQVITWQLNIIRKNTNTIITLGGTII